MPQAADRREEENNGRNNDVQLVMLMTLPSRKRIVHAIGRMVNETPKEKFERQTQT